MTSIFEYVGHTASTHVKYTGIYKKNCYEPNGIPCGHNRAHTAECICTVSFTMLKPNTQIIKWWIWMWFKLIAEINFRTLLIYANQTRIQVYSIQMRVVCFIFIQKQKTRNKNKIMYHAFFVCCLSHKCTLNVELGALQLIKFVMIYDRHTKLCRTLYDATISIKWIIPIYWLFTVDTRIKIVWTCPFCKILTIFESIWYFIKISILYLLW